ncbi:GDP-fucose protein O-fucosyltransferase 1-like [Apostichopus japonicus]|uniref:GDP-fucose protein O-fucosyltransferase 1-like n=1 Tax=Stichopus japonicus TaxID=307972 RepID=UPI003AB68E89
MMKLHLTGCPSKWSFLIQFSLLLLLCGCYASGANIEIDPNGYVAFCPCMGRFGNQADHYLGALGFAKQLDRTLILPPWVEYPYRSATSDQIPFKTYFEVDTIAKYHRVIPMETFMKELAPTVWPEGKRIGFCYRKDATSNECSMKNGNPFGPFWNKFNINFDGSQEYSPLSFSSHSGSLKAQWDNTFPASEFPVLAFAGAPASFPVEKHNLDLQRYFKWSKDIEEQANLFIIEELAEGPFVGIHLRHGLDWDNVCTHVDSSRHLFASPQCLGYFNEYGTVTKELCAPPKDVMKKQLKKIVKKIKAKAVFVATDSDAMINELQKAVKVKVVQRTPAEPHVDLAILAKSDHYIANCVSSFSSFAKRERDVYGKPTSFWAFTPKETKQEL